MSDPDREAPATDLVPRFVQARVEEALADTPVVLIQGPRQCGKTTLARQIATARGYTYLSFDDPALRDFATADPVGFCRGLSDRVVLDEIQRVPELFVSIKLVVDERRLPGRFLLTGSANVHRMPSMSDSLAGRIEIVRLRPLSAMERVPPGTDVGLLDAMFGDFESLGAGGGPDRAGESPEARLVRGGFPTLLAQPSVRRRRAWLSQYVDVIASRDLVDTLEARRPELARPLLGLAAARTGRLLNIAEMSRSLSVNVPTLRTYLHHLELLFVVERLSPWSTNRSHRIVKTPKLHITDTGLCSALLGVDADALRAERELFGQLLETWVVQELRRQATWHEEEHGFFHFRDRDGHEVDLVIERYGRAIAGVEVKASATVRPVDLRGLQRLQSLAGERFVGGTLVHLGDHTLSFGDKLRAVPLSALWNPFPTR